MTLLVKLITSLPPAAKNPRSATSTARCIACMRYDGFVAIPPLIAITIPKYAGISAVGAWLGINPTTPTTINATPNAIAIFDNSTPW
jgi:hypothetical protein